MKDKFFFWSLVAIVGAFDFLSGGGSWALEGTQLAVIPPIIAGSLISGGASLLGGLLGGKNQKIEQGPLETPEQSEARRALLDIFKTGSFGDEANKITLGEEIGVPLGNF